MDSELEFFNMLMESSPVRIIFVLLILAIFAILIMAYQSTRASSKNVSSQNEQQTGLITIIAELTVTTGRLNQMFSEAMTRNDDNYLAITTAFSRYEELLKQLESIIRETTAPFADVLVEAIKLHIETRAILRETIGGQIAELTQNVAGQKAVSLYKTGFRFPPPHDCRWRVAIVSAAKDGGTIPIFGLPIWEDHNIIGAVDSSGEVVKIIQETAFTGWFAISQQFGAAPLSGWIESGRVSIQSVKDHKESIQ